MSECAIGEPLVLPGYQLLFSTNAEGNVQRLGVYPPGELPAADLAPGDRWTVTLLECDLPAGFPVGRMFTWQASEQ